MQPFIFIMVTLVLAGTAHSQVQAQKSNLNKDLRREKIKRDETARDLVRGHLREARADHHAAVAAHKEVHRDLRNISHQQARRLHAAVVRHRQLHHHRYHPRRHPRVIVHHRTD